MYLVDNSALLAIPSQHCARAPPPRFGFPVCRTSKELAAVEKSRWECLYAVSPDTQLRL